MDTYQSNTRESFTDEEDAVGHPSIPMPVTTNTSTTSSIESVEAVLQKSLHKVVSGNIHIIGNTAVLHSCTKDFCNFFLVQDFLVTDKL